ncbi:MAG: hypothetical protein EAZ61_12340 [Oscillatoriales cyanobacterium]|nr:MAG: hypothetical protein EAZ61_12340 [Oscillatoriales cyanobacterium]
MAQQYSDAHTADERNLGSVSPVRPNGRSAHRRRLAVQVLAAICSVGLVSCANDATEDIPAAPPEPTPAAVVSPTPPPESEPMDRDALWETYDRDNAERLTAISRILAGLAPESTTISIDSAAWTNYAAEIASAWGQLESTQLEPLRTWRDQNLAQVPRDAPIIYPFSGPDFLYASSFFPDAPVYVMIGLEPVGALPDFENASEEELSSVFEWVNKSLYALLNFSFFRTNAMEKDLKDRGTLPLLMLFAARNGYEVLDLAYVGIDDQGKVKRLEAGNPDKLIPGIRIDLLGKEGEKPQQLYYFSMDLSDAGFDSRPGLKEFFGQLDRPVSYLKAASYLMHNEYFSIVRDALLERSQFILQDDSGIPLRFLDANNWTRSFFGEYTKPIDLFSTRLQADLKAEYTADPSIVPLPFGVGYKYDGDSNLMLAQRQGDPPLRGELESPYDLMPPPASRDAAKGDEEENPDEESEKAAPRRRERNDDPNDNPDDERDRPDAESDTDGKTGKTSDDDRGDRRDASNDDENRVPMPDILRQRLESDNTDGNEDAPADDTNESDAEAENDTPTE